MNNIITALGKNRFEQLKDKELFITFDIDTNEVTYDIADYDNWKAGKANIKRTKSIQNALKIHYIFCKETNILSKRLHLNF